jgi:hypothetical protein
MGPRGLRLYFPNESGGWSPLALVPPKFWPSFRFDHVWDVGDSGLACATNLCCVHDLWCVRF